MINYSVLSKRPKHFLRLTGITLEEFAVILDKFRSAWERYLRSERSKRNDWERKAGGGNTPRLKFLEDKLLFILVYVRFWQVVITRPDTNEVLYLGSTQDGKMHDKAMIDEEELAVHHDTQKGQNTTFSRIRIRVEHALSGVKRNHSVADTCRNIKDNTDDLFMSIACGLHNLRVANRYCPS